MTAPCEGCSDRHFKCWGSCSRYNEFDKAKQAERAARLKAREADELNFDSAMRTSGKYFAAK